MNLSNQLKKLDIRNVKVDGNKTFEQFVREAAHELKRYIETEYITSRQQYSPKVYQRDRHSVPWKDTKNYHFIDSLFVDDFLQVGVDNRTLAIKLRYDANAYHESVVRINGRYGADGYLPILLNYGWSWDGWEGTDDFFHGFEGMFFIENGIRKFLQDRRFQKKGISININSVFTGTDGRVYQYQSF